MNNPTPSSRLHVPARRTLLVSLAAALLPMACGNDEAAGGPPPSSAPVPQATPGSAAVATEKTVDQAMGNASPVAAAPSAPGEAPPPAGLHHLPLVPDDFLNTPEHRDPFEAPDAPRTEAVVASTTSEPLPLMPALAPEDVAFPGVELDNLHCPMILALAGEKPRAYLLGPDNLHEYVTQGDYVGRAQSTEPGQPDVHWRVYEIQEGGVSFEPSNVAGRESDTGVRPSLRLYTDQEIDRFANLFRLR